MDLEDEGWVNVQYDGTLEVHDDHDEHVKSPTTFHNPSFNASKTSREYVEDEPIYEKRSGHKEVEVIDKFPILIKEPKESSFEPDPDLGQESKSNVFYNKENQFVEMKIDSSRLSSQEPDLSHIETSPFQGDEKHGDLVVNCSAPSKMIKKEVVAWKESNQKLNFWKWGLSGGIGVFCCVGMTAATICIIMCGNGKSHKQQNHKLRIQIYPENKRVKQVVQKANEAMSAMRGVPLVKAQITFGGHYESL